MTVEENQKLIDNLKENDVIEFYISCNADRKLFKGVVKYKEQLGWITNINGEQYEIKKLIDIKVINSLNTQKKNELKKLTDKKMTNSTTNNAFQVSKIYEMLFIGDSNLRPQWKCIKKTAKTVTFTKFDETETITKRIKFDSENNEYILYANYSSASSINSKNC